MSLLRAECSPTGLREATDGARVRCVKQLGVRSHGPPLEGPARHRRRRLHGVPRRHHREHRVPRPEGRLRVVLAGRAVVGAQRLQHRLRRAARPGRPARRPHRPAADVLRRPGALPGRLRGVRPGPLGARPRRGARRAGRRRRRAHPDLARAAAARVPARAARDRHRPVGRDGRRRRGDRAVAGRPARGRHGLALGLLRQPRVRGDRARARAPPPARGARPGARPAPRRGRGRPARRRRRPAVAGHREGGRLGLGVGGRARLPRRGGPAARRAVDPVRPRRLARRRPVALRRALLRGGERRRPALQRRLLRAAPGQRAVPDLGLGLVGAAGRRGPHPGAAHGGRHGGPRRPGGGSLRPAGRRAPGRAALRGRVRRLRHLDGRVAALRAASSSPRAS